MESASSTFSASTGSAYRPILSSRKYLFSTMYPECSAPDAVPLTRTSATTADGYRRTCKPFCCVDSSRKAGNRPLKCSRVLCHAVKKATATRIAMISMIVGVDLPTICRHVAPRGASGAA